MEILQHSLKKIDKSPLNNFQKEILEIITNLFEGLIIRKISNDSIIDEKPYLDIIIRLKASDFILNFSIRDDLFVLNSNYFDINIYPEIQFNLINLLIKEVLLGNYVITLSYGKFDKLIRKEIVFDNQELKEFNQKRKISLFVKKIRRYEKIQGIKLINSIA